MMCSHDCAFANHVAALEFICYCYSNTIVPEIWIPQA